MEKPITIEEWTDYLNRKTLGFNCPICGHNHWQTQRDKDGNVMRVQMSDASNTNQLKPGYAKIISNTRPPVFPEPSLLTDIILIRCGHCGWVACFDRKFVEGELNDK